MTLRKVVLCSVFEIALFEIGLKKLQSICQPACYHQSYKQKSIQYANLKIGVIFRKMAHIALSYVIYHMGHMAWFICHMKKELLSRTNSKANWLRLHYFCMLSTENWLFTKKKKLIHQTNFKPGIHGPLSLMFGPSPVRSTSQLVFGQSCPWIHGSSWFGRRCWTCSWTQYHLFRKPI